MTLGFENAGACLMKFTYLPYKFCPKFHSFDFLKTVSNGGEKF